MNNQIIAPYLRKRWEYANKKVKALDSSLFPQSSYIRIDQKLSNGVGNYVFDPMRQNGQQGTYGQLLNRNDLFLMYGIGLLLSYELTANPGAGVLASSLSDLGFYRYNPCRRTECIQWRSYVADRYDSDPGSSGNQNFRHLPSGR